MRTTTQTWVDGLLEGKSTIRRGVLSSRGLAVCWNRLEVPAAGGMGCRYCHE
jgi:hypothetical protein